MADNFLSKVRHELRYVSRTSLPGVRKGVFTRSNVGSRLNFGLDALLEFWSSGSADAMEAVKQGGATVGCKVFLLYTSKLPTSHNLPTAE